MIEALSEDIGRGDLFERVASDGFASASIISKADGVFAGEVYAKALCEELGLECEFFIHDTNNLKKGDKIATLSGSQLSLLKCERTFLNTIQHASGIATKVSHFVKLLDGFDVKLLDTRKTRPKLRVFEKYAVRCGGGTNHRFGLDDALMLKDTHLAIIKDLHECVRVARGKLPFTCKIEIECESLDQAKEAMSAGADIVMCDNMGLDMVREVVEFRNNNYVHVLIEASGNIDEQSIAQVARCGVDAISSGSLIHQATWLDFSMKMN